MSSLRTLGSGGHPSRRPNVFQVSAHLATGACHNRRVDTSRIRRALAMVLALLLLPLPVAAILTPTVGTAAASNQGFSRQYGQELSGVLGQGVTWLGSYRAGSSMGVTYAWCVQGGAVAPSSAGKSKSMAAPVLSYALAKWSGSNYGSYSKNETHAALSYLVHSRFDVGLGAVSAASRRAAYVAKTPTRIKTLADKMWQEAVKYSGTYSARGKITRTGATTAQITGVGVRTGAVDFVPGFSGTVSLTGPATFKNGDWSKDFTTTTSGFSWSDIQITGPGKIKVHVSISGLPAKNVTVWSGNDNVFGSSGTVQDMVTVLRETVTTSDALDVEVQSPSITTRASDIEVVGDELAHQDMVTINAPQRFSGQKVSLTAYLRYAGTSTPAQVAVSSSSIPGSDRGQASTTVTLNANGNATWVTPKLRTARQVGYYTWVVVSEPAARGLLARYRSDYGIPAETRNFSISPVVKTIASYQLSQNTVTDQITGSGFPAGQRVTYRATLYRHPDGVNMPTNPNGVPQIPSGAVAVGNPIVRTVTANSAGQANVTVTQTVPERPIDTHYSWVVSADPIPGWNGYTSSYGIKEESVEVKGIHPGEPAVSTVASDQTAQPGQTISDTFEINRHEADLRTYPLEITSILWHLKEEPTFNAPIEQQAGHPVEVSRTTLAPIDRMDFEPFRVPDAHAYTLPTDPALAGGWWVYTYCFPATGDWADDTPASERVRGYDGVCDTTVYAQETVFVPWTPQITTRATPSSERPGAIGDTVADRIEVADGKPDSEITVRLTAYEPTVNAPVRTPWADMAMRPEALYSEQVTIQLDEHGRGTGQVSGFPAAEPGYYPWTETIIEAPAGTENIGVESDYGIDSEIAVIKFQPIVTTVASENIAVAGAQLTDQFTISGLPPGQSVTVTHHGWCSHVAPILQDEIPAGAIPAGSVTSFVTADSDGTVPKQTSDPIVAPSNCPYFVWTERIEEGNLHQSWQSPYGIAQETTGIISVSTKANPYAQAGTTTYDIATVTGPVPAGSALYFDYYRQEDSENADDDELLATVGPVAVNGPGEYLSPTVNVSRATGKEYFRERLYIPGPDGLIDLEAPPAIRGAARLAEETTVIVDVSSTATPVANVGEEFDDIVHLDLGGELPQGSYLEWILLENTGPDTAPLTETGYQGDTLIVQTDRVYVDGSGDYRSPSLRLNREATVHWVEALYIPGQQAPIAQGGYRLDNETTTITRNPPSLEPPGKPESPDRPEEPELPQTGTGLAVMIAASGLGLIAVGCCIYLVRSRHTTSI